MTKKKGEKRARSVGDQIEKREQSTAGVEVAKKKKIVEKQSVAENGQAMKKEVKANVQLNNKKIEKKGKPEKKKVPAENVSEHNTDSKEASSKKEQKLQKAQNRRKALISKVDELSIKTLKEKIAEMESRDTLTKTAKRKLSVYKKKLSVHEGTYSISPSKNDKANSSEIPNKNAKALKVNTGKQTQTKDDTTKGTLKQGNKKKKQVAGNFVKVKKDESSENDDEEDESDEDMETAEEPELKANVKNQEEEEDDENDESDEEDDEVKNKSAKVTKNQGDKKKIVENDQKSGKKKRFVVFVGNVPYSANEDTLKKHFLTKVSAITDIRLPKKDNSEKHKGIAYIEVGNVTDYEKALSLHHSFILGRRINVQYTAPKHGENKAEVVAKNKKLHALREAGVLAGSKKKNKMTKKKGKQNSEGTAT